MIVVVTGSSSIADPDAVAKAIEWLMSMEDRPHFLGTTDQRARWGGVGGEKYKSGDSCGAVLAVWRGPEMLRQGEATRCWPIPEWRPRGRTRRVE